VRITSILSPGDAEAISRHAENVRRRFPTSAPGYVVKRLAARARRVPPFPRQMGGGGS